MSRCTSGAAAVLSRMGDWTRCAERPPSAATVAIHASGGRCSTRPCAHAVGPSSFSAVRRQVWLSPDKARALPWGGRRQSCSLPHLCRSLLRHVTGVRLASSSWLGCIAVPSHLDSSDSSLRLASSGWLVVLLVLLPLKLEDWNGSKVVISMLLTIALQGMLSLVVIKML